MPIRVKCGNCKKTLSVKDHLAGKKIKCPVCQGVVVVSPQPPTKTPPAKTPPGEGSTPKAPAAQAPPAQPKKPVPTSKPAPNGKKPATRAPEPPTPKAPEPPAPPPEEVEAEAAALFGGEPPPVVYENPKTIDFKCEWCDVELHFPLDMGGKRTQCTNEECRRLVKVPMPTVQAKKDWRKMDRQGPASARINQPEELEDAWGTENTTRARQDSLAKAGAIDTPPKPPLGFVGILGRVLIVSGLFSVLGGLGVGGCKLIDTNQQKHGIEDAEKLVFAQPPKVVEPVLAAEVHRTIALLYMQKRGHGLRNPANKVQKNFQGARYRVAQSGKEQTIHEQLFLLELALSQIELGGDGDVVDYDKTRQSWDTVRQDLLGTLGAIENPEAQTMAVRAVITRLLEKSLLEKKDNLAGIAEGLAGSLSKPGAKGQHIAILLKFDKLKTIREILDPKDLDAFKELEDRKAPPETITPQLRFGFAEGYARKGEFAEAEKFTIKGLPKDCLETCVGVATIALSNGKKEDAVKFINQGIALAENPKVNDLSGWQLFFLAKLAIRTAESDEALKDVYEKRWIPEPFRLRVQLEIVQAKCDKAAGPVSLEVLTDLEATDREGTTLALAWYVVAQQQARKGLKQAAILKAFNARANRDSQANVEKLLPLAEIGAFHGAIK